MRPPDGLTPGQRLAAKAAEAAEVRTWQTHPDVVALRVERTRTLVDRLIWGGIIVGLLFTASNVQAFVADTTNAVFGSLGWWVAWLVDPTIAAVLLGILITERRVAPGQIKLDRIARVAKWVLLGMTYGANTWQAWADRSPAGIMLHSLPPLVVFLAAEVVPGLHAKLTGFAYWTRDEAGKRTESAAPLISDHAPSEPGSGGLGRAGSEHYPPAPETWTAPLDRSGSPAGPTRTVLPGRPDRSAQTAVVDRSGLGEQTGPPSQTAPPARAAAHQPPTSPPSQTVGGPEETAGPDSGGLGGSLSDDELARLLREWADQDGTAPSRDRVRGRYRIGSARADRLLAQLDPPTRPRAATNGQARRKESK